MAFAPPVTELIEEGERIIAKLDAAAFKVTAAFWWYNSEEDRWKLVIATPQIHESGPRDAYAKLFKILVDLGVSFKSIGRSDITIVGPRDRLVLLLDDYFRRSGLHEPLANDTGVQFVIGRAIEGAFVYRLPNYSTWQD